MMMLDEVYDDDLLQRGMASPRLNIESDAWALQADIISERGQPPLVRVYGSGVGVRSAHRQRDRRFNADIHETGVLVRVYLDVADGAGKQIIVLCKAV
jgi:hypothetical protein